MVGRGICTESRLFNRMIRRKRLPFGFIALFLAVVGLGEGVCQGWWPYGWPYSGSYGLFSNPLDLEKLPYFALFPPVYYSRPVPRAYGYTPFASLPEQATVAEIRTTQPLVLNNSFVAATGIGCEGRASQDPGPQIVRNPFVDRGDANQTGEPRLAGR